MFVVEYLAPMGPPPSLWNVNKRLHFFMPNNLHGSWNLTFCYRTDIHNNFCNEYTMISLNLLEKFNKFWAENYLREFWVCRPSWISIQLICRTLTTCMYFDIWLYIMCVCVVSCQIRTTRTSVQRGERRHAIVFICIVSGETVFFVLDSFAI